MDFFFGEVALIFGGLLIVIVAFFGLICGIVFLVLVFLIVFGIVFVEFDVVLVDVGD